MAQVMFSDLMNSYRMPGNDAENEHCFGRYSNAKYFKHCYSVSYEQSMNPAEFIDWIIQYMNGAVILRGNVIWFNSDVDEVTLILQFDGVNTYGDKILWQYHKNPYTDSFERYLPYDGNWSR